MIRFHFEDCGQDFLWWDVEDNSAAIGKIVDAGPFQAWLWANGRNYINLSHPHGLGDRLLYTDDLLRSMETGYCRTLKYRVTKIEHLAETAGAA